MNEETKTMGDDKLTQIVGFDAVKATAQAVLLTVQSMKVETEAEAQAATLKRSEIKSVLKMVEDRRKEIVKPLDDAKKAKQAEAKGISEPLEKAEVSLFKMVSAWQMEQRLIAEKAAEAEKKAAEERLAATLADDEATLEEVEQVQEHVAQAAKPVKMSKSLAPMKTRETWKYIVEDFPAFVKWCIETKQLEFLAVNDPAFGARVRAAADKNPIREAGGVNIYSEVGPA